MFYARTRFFIASLLTGILAHILGYALALAAESPTTGEPMTSVATESTSPWDNFYLNYFGIIHGSPLGDPTSINTVDRNGNPSPTSTVNLDSEITTAYLITPDIGVGPDIPFLFVPVLGKGLVLGDLGLKAFDKSLIHEGGFNLYVNLYAQAPTSQLSQANHLAFALKSTPAIRYVVPGTRFTLGSWSEIKDYFGVTADKTFKLYALPYVNYQLTRNLSLNLGYEMEWHHNVGDSGASFAAYQTDLQPGFVWNISPQIIVNPYLQVFTTNRVSYDTMAIGGVVSASAF